jgi:glutathione synthase/RimK-type ligase-like ATP-grasp enzyme
MLVVWKKGSINPMAGGLKSLTIFKKIQKSKVYSRLREYFPMAEPRYVDDRNNINDAEVIRIDWPAQIEKPKFGVIRDYGIYPRWTKYCRFLENNSFEYGIYNLHAHDWIEKADNYDIFIGFVSSEFWYLQEMREKYYVLETFLGKTTYPSTGHILLYEDKHLEAHLSRIYKLPFANTYISQDKIDALQMIKDLPYPVVSKIIPSSGSMGVELVHSEEQGRKIVEQVFSPTGRKTHQVSFRQKNYIYFQEYIPNDGYDIRVIIVGNQVFGYYRKVLKGDFRASGMNLIEKRELPEKAMRLAYQVYNVIKSPKLVVDMVRGIDGNFHIIEFSPICQMEFPEQLHVNGIPGFYIFEDDAFRFEKGRYWLHELALREFLLKDYLPKTIAKIK